LCILVWAIFFNDGGILQSAYNSVAKQVNSVWGNISGGQSDSGQIMPYWKSDQEAGTTAGKTNGNVSDSTNMTDD
jgi:hypothetical protein